MKIRFRYQFFLFLLISCIFVPMVAFSQVSMRIKIVQSNFLQYEDIFIRLAIRNISAHPLAFGEADTLKGKLRFEIFSADTADTKLVPLRSGTTVPDLTGLIIPPGTNRTFLFNLSSHYDLRKIGKYSVRAVISHPQLSNAYQSNEEFFTILKGSQIWARTVGLPLLDNGATISSNEKTKVLSKEQEEILDKRKIETREYRILRYNTGTQVVYCLSIEDKNKVYFLRHIGFDLGPELRPKCEVDFLSRLNILLAASPKVFAFYQYEPDGTLSKKEILIKTSAEPFLATDLESGVVRVIGGREAKKDVDYEEIQDLPFLEDMSDNELFVSDSAKKMEDIDEKITGKKKKSENSVFDDLDDITTLTKQSQEQDTKTFIKQNIKNDNKNQDMLIDSEKEEKKANSPVPEKKEKANKQGNKNLSADKTDSSSPIIYESNFEDL